MKIYKYLIITINLNLYIRTTTKIFAYTCLIPLFSKIISIQDKVNPGCLEIFFLSVNCYLVFGNLVVYFALFTVSKSELPFSQTCWHPILEVPVYPAITFILWWGELTDTSLSQINFFYSDQKSLGGNRRYYVPRWSHYAIRT